MSRALREPLLHFLVLGALLFGAYAWLRPGESAQEEIRVSAAQIEHLVEQFRRTWQRSPDASELESLIDSYVREEVMYREGVALGLDRDDPVIRRRVHQKVGFLVENTASQEPGEAQLQEYYAAHRDRFVAESRVSFAQVYVNPERADADRYARQVLAQLDRNARALDDLGDPSLLPRELSDARETEVASALGETFMRDLRLLKIGAWQGPIRSAYGLHLVRLDARTEAQPLPFAQARDDVLREYQTEQRQKAMEQMYAQARARYAVTIEKPSEASAEDALSDEPVVAHR